MKTQPGKAAADHRTKATHFFKMFPITHLSAPVTEPQNVFR